MKKNNPLIRFYSLSILFFSCNIFLASADNSSEKLFVQKTDSRLLIELSNKKPTEFVVLMNEQADVSDANNLLTKEEKGEFVFKKLSELSKRSQSSLITFLNANSIPYKAFWIVNSISVTGNIDLAKKLIEFPEVKSLLENSKFYVEKPVVIDYAAKQDKTLAVEWQITLVNADKVWALGFKGQGAVVSGGDTGYEWTHAAIKKQYRGWNGSAADHNYNWHDAIHSGTGGSCGINLTAPCDDGSHGTHTMGSMVGDDNTGNQIGMAPLAKWIGCRNMNDGVGTLTTYLEHFQWMLAPTDINDKNPMPSKAPHVINNSWGCAMDPPAEVGCTVANFPVHRTAIKNLRTAGVVVVASAGNAGSNCSTIGDSPAIFDESFSVGSTTSSNAMSSFSSRGPVTIDGSNRLKPNISAPGSNIRSCVPGGGYSSMSGTSMAGPQVAGLVALLISANPKLAGQVDSIENIIERTAFRSITNTQTCGGTSPSTWPNNTVGYGRIDALAAVKAAQASTTSIPLITSNGIINAYPNPTNDAITFLMNDVKEIGTIKIYSIEGQILAEHKTNPSENKFKISVSNFANGLYIFEFETSLKTYYGKFVKN